MKCEHKNINKLRMYGEVECEDCEVSMDIADPNMLNADGSPTKEAQVEWNRGICG